MIGQIIDIRRTIPHHKTRKWKTRTSVKRIVIHTSASNNQDPVITAKFHIKPGLDNHISKKGCPSIAYHDFIDSNGKVYRCNDYTDITWHCGSYNTGSIGIVMAFRGQDNIIPVPAQWNSMIYHIAELCMHLRISPLNVIGHREVPGMIIKLGNGSTRYRKVCPGMAIDLDRVRKQIIIRIQERLYCKGLYLGPLDGVLNKKTREGLYMVTPVDLGER